MTFSVALIILTSGSAILAPPASADPSPRARARHRTHTVEDAEDLLEELEYLAHAETSRISPEPAHLPAAARVRVAVPVEPTAPVPSSTPSVVRRILTASERATALDRLHTQEQGFADVFGDFPEGGVGHMEMNAFAESFRPAWDRAAGQLRQLLLARGAISVSELQRLLDARQAALEQAALYRAGVLRVHADARDEIRELFICNPRARSEDHVRPLLERWRQEVEEATQVLSETEALRPPLSRHDFERTSRAAAVLQRNHARWAYLRSADPEVRAFLDNDPTFRETAALIRNWAAGDALSRRGLRIMTGGFAVFVGASVIGLGSAITSLITDIPHLDAITMVAVLTQVGSPVVALRLARRQSIRETANSEARARIAQSLHEYPSLSAWQNFIHQIHDTYRVHAREEPQAVRLQCQVHRLMGQSCAYRAGLGGDAPCATPAGPFR